MRPFRIDSLDAITGSHKEIDPTWLLRAEDSIEFLKQNAEEDAIVIYASAPNVFIHGVLALERKLTPQDTSDLQQENPPSADDSWRIQQVWGSAVRHRMYLEPPLSDAGKALVGGEKLIYRRRFSGVDSGTTVVELSQKLVHSLDLYFVADRNAYCRLDARGDIEEVIKIRQENQQSTWDSIEVVTVLRRDLDKFMALSRTCLVLRFDFTRVRRKSFHGWGDFQHLNKEQADLYYHGGVDAQGSFCNGVMVVRPLVTVKDLVREWRSAEDPTHRRYATFKIFDRRNDVNVETSCAPECLSNYFQESSILPWEVSPAFFRPEVLARFKADPEKYALEDRRISCRSAWHLQTYDINEAGQVHTYIVYLSRLPYEEQLYWQSFNEWPKGTISARAHQTDILGEWDLEHEPLRALKERIAVLDQDPPPWWKPRGESLADAVNLPATDSVKEWADELLALDQYLVEGFQVKPLGQLSVAAGRPIEKMWASLRVLQEVLVGCGETEETVKSLMAPLYRLHGLRTDVRGHAAVAKKKAAASAAVAGFGSLRAHFQHLVAACEESFKEILNALGVRQKGE